MKIKLSKIAILIVGVILWPLIIAIPQFNLHYSTGLLNGTLNYGEIPKEFFLGLASGLFAALLFSGISILLAKIITAVRKKELKGSTTFFFVTLLFFVLMLITQSKRLYSALKLDEKKVNETRELIKEYKIREGIK